MHSVIDWNCIWKLTLLASRQGSLENGYDKEEAAERYDRSEVVRMDGERWAAALVYRPIMVGPGHRCGAWNPGPALSPEGETGYGSRALSCHGEAA